MAYRRNLHFRRNRILESLSLLFLDICGVFHELFFNTEVPLRLLSPVASPSVASPPTPPGSSLQRGPERIGRLLLATEATGERSWRGGRKTANEHHPISGGKRLKDSRMCEPGTLARVVARDFFQDSAVLDLTIPVRFESNHTLCAKKVVDRIDFSGF